MTADHVLTPAQQEAMTRQLADALQILGQAFPHLVPAAAKQIEMGAAEAIAEFTDPDDPFSLRYDIEVPVNGERITLVTLPWLALKLTAQQVNAEYQARRRDDPGPG